MVGLADRDARVRAVVAFQVRPADRILWRGEGMEQRWYACSELRFSDHRPVAALFSTRLSGDGDGHGKPAPAHSSRF
jgi:hypothetical protein